MRTLIVVLVVGLLAACGDDKCCKTCDQGKACGDTCIAADLTCHAGAGCACNK